VVTDNIPNDDTLGFLTCEIVQTLTEEAPRVKAIEDLQKIGMARDGPAEREIKKRRRYWEADGGGLFETSEERGTPVEPKHIREAFRRLQTLPKKYTFMRQGYAGLKTPLRLT
jgi:transcription initiation protein SPT3